MFRSLRNNRSFRLFLGLALVASQSLVAAEPVAPADNTATQPAEAAPVDVVLGVQGVLQGYVVDSQGSPAMGIEVKLHAPDGQTYATTSDHKGRFGYRGLAGAAYTLETEHGIVACRAWTADAAPPRAAATLLVVHDANLVRGQWGPPQMINQPTSRLKRAFTNPFFVATVVGAAIAIPVAIHNSDDDSGS